MDWYLKTLEKIRARPNFWCSVEYAQKAGLREVRVRDRGSVYVYDPATGWCVLPPIHPKDGYRHTGWTAEKIWSDFVDFPGEDLGYAKHFLDYEYIFDPKAFTQMQGGKWMTFRKNSRKWRKRSGGADVYIEPGKIPDAEFRDLLVAWLGTLPDDEKIHDDEVLVKYLYGGENRKVLFDKRGRLMGVNIWDENWRYTNFRYCICRPEPFLSEYMRLLFYTDVNILESGKLVNDGGVLDKPNLKRFKDKMNPLRTRPVFSWKQEGQNGVSPVLHTQN